VDNAVTIGVIRVEELPQLRCSASSAGSGRIACDRHIAPNISDNRSAQADYGIRAYGDSVSDCRAGTNQRAISDRAPTTQHRAWSDMHPIADNAVVLKAGSRVDDARRPDTNSRVDNGARTYKGPSPQQRTIRDYRRVVHNRHERAACSENVQRAVEACRVVADGQCNGRISPQCLKRIPPRRVDWPVVVLRRLAQFVDVIDVGRDNAALSVQCVDYDSSMATAPQDNCIAIGCHPNWKAPFGVIDKRSAFRPRADTKQALPSSHRCPDTIGKGDQPCRLGSNETNV
jgi:hypothetical protein